MKYGVVIFCVSAVILVSGCASKSGEQMTRPDMQGADAGQAGRYDDARALLYEEARRVVKDVFFAFDSAELDQAAVLQLQKNATWLIENPSVSMIIEGHCDEQGTDEYNMALGEKRADVTQRFLVKAGVDFSRLSTVSYGEERPFALGHNEAAWAKNRRAHFVIQE